MPGTPQFPLTKTLDPADYRLLAPELVTVDQFDPTMSQASDHRRWEYAMALRAIDRWYDQAPTRPKVMRTAIDVGGSGSPLFAILSSVGLVPSIIDPNYNYPLERILDKKPLMQASVVTCISVIEHVPLADLERFVLALGKAVMPGGLLFLTCDFTEDGTEDTHHFHWMRAQIFDERKLTLVADQLYRENNLIIFGDVDKVYHGPQIYPAYTFASLCMVKQEASR